MSTLWVIGDSTVSSFEDKYYYPRYGYGTMLDKYLNDNVKVVNIALSGRSSKSYLSEPEYNTLINGMKQGVLDTMMKRQRRKDIQVLLVTI